MARGRTFISMNATHDVRFIQAESFLNAPEWGIGVIHQQPWPCPQNKRIYERYNMASSLVSPCATGIDGQRFIFVNIGKLSSA